MQTYFVSFLIVLSFDIIAEAARINYKSENGLIDTLRLQDHVPRKERTERIQIIPSRHQNYYRRRKAEKERGDKKANAWFEKKREYARKTRNELTKRIKTGTYSAADLEKYQKKLDSSRRYEAKNYSIRNKSRTNKPEKFRKLYQRKKEAMERGDKEAIAWFEKRKKSRHDSECGLTQRIQSNTYSTYDLEKYQRRNERINKYRHKRKNLECQNSSDI